MILPFSNKSPAGNATFFEQKITHVLGYVPKLHTLREKYSRFHAGCKLHCAYHSRQPEMYVFAKYLCKGVEPIRLVANGDIKSGFDAYVNGYKLTGEQKHLLITNDGFDNAKSFTNWILNGKAEFNGGIVHFTENFYHPDMVCDLQKTRIHKVMFKHKENVKAIQVYEYETFINSDDQEGDMADAYKQPISKFFITQ